MSKKIIIIGTTIFVLLTGCGKMGNSSEVEQPKVTSTPVASQQPTVTPSPTATIQPSPTSNNTIQPTPVQNKSTQNVYFEKMAKNVTENSVGLYINLPTEEQVKSIKLSKSLNLQDTKEKIIVIPRFENTSIEIYAISINSKGEIVKGNKIYSEQKCSKDYALELQAIRPEGAPNFMVQITTPSGTKVESYISYNGKDGNPNIEPILKK